MLKVALHLIPKKAVDIGNATAKPVTAPPTPKPATPKPASPKPATSPTVATSTVAAPAADPQKAEPELTWTDMEDATIIGMKALDKSWKEIGIAIPEKHTEDLRARYELFNIQKHNSKEDNQMVSNGAGPKGGENNAEAKEAVAMKQSKEKQRKEKKSRELTEEAKEKKFEEMNAKAQKAKAEAAKWEAEVAKAKSGTIGSKGKARQAKPKDAHGKELKGILKKSGSSRKGLSGLAPTSHQSLPLLFVGDTDGLTADEVITSVLIAT